MKDFIRVKGGKIGRKKDWKNKIGRKRLKGKKIEKTRLDGKDLKEKIGR